VDRTDNGLVEIQQYPPVFYKKKRLPLNNIWALAQDSHNETLIGTYGKV
jgi:hypothetical protein